MTRSGNGEIRINCQIKRRTARRGNVFVFLIDTTHFGLRTFQRIFHFAVGVQWDFRFLQWIHYPKQQRDRQAVWVRVDGR